MRRIAGPSSLLPAPSLRDRVVSRRRHRVSSHNGLRAPHFGPPKLADPGPGPGPGPNKFAPGPLAPRTGPGCVPARPARWRGARPPPTSPRGAAAGRSGRPPTSVLFLSLNGTDLHLQVQVHSRRGGDECTHLPGGSQGAVNGLHPMDERCRSAPPGRFVRLRLHQPPQSRPQLVREGVEDVECRAL